MISHYILILLGRWYGVVEKARTHSFYKHMPSCQVGLLPYLPVDESSYGGMESQTQDLSIARQSTLPLCHSDPLCKSGLLVSCIYFTLNEYLKIGTCASSLVSVRICVNMNVAQSMLVPCMVSRRSICLSSALLGG